MNKKIKGNLILLITALIWGSAFVSQSVGMDHISPNTFNGLRSILGGIVLLPVIYFLDRGKGRQKTDRAGKKMLLFSGVVCGLILCAASTLQTLGLRYTTVANSGFITTMYIILVPFLGILFKKKVNVLTCIAAVIALFGLYLISFSDSNFKVNPGDLMTLISALLFAFHILAIDFFSDKADGVKMACLQFFVCGLANLLLMFVFEEPNLEAIRNCWSAIVYAGILSCGVGYTLQIVGQKYTDPSSAAIILSLEAVFGALAGFILLNETLTIYNIIGCAIMLIAILIVQLSDLVSEPKKL